jgi:hypothetical protein
MAMTYSNVISMMSGMTPHSDQRRDPQQRVSGLVYFDADGKRVEVVGVQEVYMTGVAKVRLAQCEVEAVSCRIKPTMCFIEHGRDNVVEGERA